MGKFTLQSEWHVLQYTLETFTEVRSTAWEQEPYTGVTYIQLQITGDLLRFSSSEYRLNSDCYFSVNIFFTIQPDININGQKTSAGGFDTVMRASYSNGLRGQSVRLSVRLTQISQKLSDVALNSL